MAHFIYCGEYYFEVFQGNEHTEKFKEIILSKMRKYGIQFSILTMLLMQRQNLITKEKAKRYYQEKISLPRIKFPFTKEDNTFKLYEGSINDDLDKFVTNLENAHVEEESIWSFFTPKLSKEELNLVQVGDKKHLKTYWKKKPDVDSKEMKKSDSKDKYVKVECRRATMLLVTLSFKAQLRKQLKKMKIEFEDSE